MGPLTRGRQGMGIYGEIPRRVKIRRSKSENSNGVKFDLSLIRLN